MSYPNPLHQPSEIAQKRPYPSIRHNLYEIDLERKTAFCTVCGYTEIHVSKSRTKLTPKVFCICRYRELVEEQRKTRREEGGLKPGWKPRHFLSEIDSEKMTAHCSICGPTKIRKRNYKGFPSYACATNERGYGQKYRRTHYTSRVSSPLVHVLSQIDEENKTAVCSLCGPVEIYVWQGERKVGRRCSNARVVKIPPAQKIRREFNPNIIDRYKVEQGCKHCGYNTNPNLLNLRSHASDKKVLRIEKLLMLNRKDLMQELENCEVLCIYCCSLVNVELG
jgi:hypothetical protein